MARKPKTDLALNASPKSNAESLDKSVRYNPNSEKEDIRQTVAANWELLRRSTKFKEVAAEWIANAAFRLEHVRERTTYRDNVQARCALDCMLTSEQRYALARWQMRESNFFWDPTANYGPIVVTRHLDRMTTGLRACISDLFDVKPHDDPGHVLWIDQPWPATPPLFRDQFVSIFTDEDLKEILLTDEATWLLRIGNHLVSGQTPSSEELTALGRYLFVLGDNFKDLSRDYKMAAIRRQFYPEQRLDEILQRVKHAIPYDPKTGHDHHSRRSFMGTQRQWEMFLAWEAHGGNAYSAAREFLSEPPSTELAVKQRRGARSRSELQRDIASSVRQAKRAIEDWIKRVYPIRDVIPATVRQPKPD